MWWYIELTLQTYSPPEGGENIGEKKKATGLYARRQTPVISQPRVPQNFNKQLGVTKLVGAVKNLEQKNLPCRKVAPSRNLSAVETMVGEQTRSYPGV
jgi:hypothetical protein